MLNANPNTQTSFPEDIRLFVDEATQKPLEIISITAMLDHYLFKKDEFGNLKFGAINLQTGNNIIISIAGISRTNAFYDGKLRQYHEYLPIYDEEILTHAITIEGAWIEEPDQWELFPSSPTLRATRWSFYNHHFNEDQITEGFLPALQDFQS